MSLLNDLTSFVTKAWNGKLIVLLDEVKKAVTEQQTAESPVGKSIAEKLRSMLPAGSGDIVEKIDTLIPDSLEKRFGLTPEIKAFLKKAVAVHAVKSVTK